MEKHVTVLGILYLAFSALWLLLAIIIFTAVELFPWIRKQ
jgi:hypothetical protein